MNGNTKKVFKSKKITQEHVGSENQQIYLLKYPDKNRHLEYTYRYTERSITNRKT